MPIRNPTRLLNMHETAKLLGISYSTIKRWYKDPNGPPRVQVNKRRYITREALDRWLTSNRQKLELPRPQR